MPNVLCIPFYFKPRGIKKYSIPYMVKIELTFISIKGGVLPPYFLEVILCGVIACIVTMVMYRECSFRCSLNLSSKILEVSPMYSSSHRRSPHWNE